MKTELKQAYNVELTAACEAEESRNFSKAFAHLERAHILSQKYAWAHTRTHIRMLKLGWRTRDMREVVENRLRLAVNRRNHPLPAESSVNCWVLPRPRWHFVS
ncbi:DUF3703 domain-containing protein, partial [Marinobacter salarius]|uniref:DUF3703 domain-containing protein n=1 Tax=Marinobacter salarius TaxID=1420917 RepID=UPI0018F1A494